MADYNNYRSDHNHGSFRQQNSADATAFFNNLSFNQAWITSEADRNLVLFAEQTGKFMADNGLTNSKIRSIYGEIKRIQMSTFELEKTSFFLLKPKVAYALGREPKNEGLKLFKLVFDQCYDYVNDNVTYKNFCNIIEAILAYHRANGGN